MMAVYSNFKSEFMELKSKELKFVHVWVSGWGGGGGLKLKYILNIYQYGLGSVNVKLFLQGQCDEFFLN